MITPKVIGAGPVGHLTARVTHYWGHKITVLDQNEKRLNYLSDLKIEKKTILLIDFKKRIKTLLILIIVFLLPFLTEYFQQYRPRRVSDIFDLYYDKNLSGIVTRGPANSKLD